ncbi:MAG: hypothetical protein ACR2N7_10595 [Acidimicrobiia bacterium]
METITLIPQQPLTDEELVRMFGDAGLSVDVVPNCQDASCEICFAAIAAEAA